jgi:hypothetical protein
MTNEEYAHHLGTVVRTVAKWKAQPDLVPLPELQRALDTALSLASEEEQARFAILSGDQPQEASTELHRPEYVTKSTGINPQLPHNQTIDEALHWLDSRTPWPNGEARRRVRAALQELNDDAFDALAHRRAGVTQAQTGSALGKYYRLEGSDSYRFYSVISGETRHTTSILTKSQWLDLSIPLGASQDHLAFTPHTPVSGHAHLGQDAATAAVKRIAETVALRTRFVNLPLYWLLDADVSRNSLRGEVGTTSFVEYALTLDLLENELIDAISGGNSTLPGALPLRDRYLPDLAVLTDFKRRICVGGPVTLTAIARPRANRHPTTPDYVLLVQERSGHVLNAARRLAVIPKAFHQPLVDVTDDAQILATIEREMEEELLGRPELDTTDHEQLSADPMHSTRLSEPMRWLTDHSDQHAWRTECVGFGINAMSGNYEFASLIVVDDERWWSLYGGAVEANWETHGLRRYSSRDANTLADLISSPEWSNEGKFAFIQGIRRLRQIGGKRVTLPPIELEF